jgi:hypothetical protein
MVFWCFDGWGAGWLLRPHAVIQKNTTAIHPLLSVVFFSILHLKPIQDTTLSRMLLL